MIRGRLPALCAGGLTISGIGRRLLGALCLLALVGCGGTPARTVQGDPLLGPGGATPLPPADRKASGEQGREPSSGTLRSELPELPAPNPRITAAGLASGQEQTLDAAPRLQIGVGPTTPKPAIADLGRGQSTVVITQPTPVIPASDPGPWRGQGTLQQPIPVNESRTPTVPVAVPSAQARVETSSQGIEALERRGVTLHRLERTENGEYKFLCLLPDRQNPTTFHRYEARAAGDPVNAVRAVIEQIDRDGR